MDEYTSPVSAQSPRALPAIQRWAECILKVVDANCDPRTLSDWARLANVGRGTLRERCRAAGMRSKASLDFCSITPDDSTCAICCDTRTIVGRFQQPHTATTTYDGRSVYVKSRSDIAPAVSGMSAFYCEPDCNRGCAPPP